MTLITALMQQIEFFEIDSPCIGVCELTNKGYCKGCLRSRQERQHWHSLDDNTKHQINQACQKRKQRIKQKQLQIEENQSELTHQKGLDFTDAVERYSSKEEDKDPARYNEQDQQLMF